MSLNWPMTHFIAERLCRETLPDYQFAFAVFHLRNKFARYVTCNLAAGKISLHLLLFTAWTLMTHWLLIMRTANEDRALRGRGEILVGIGC